MAEHSRHVAVLADPDGNVYLIPREVVERGRVPDELMDALARLIVHRTIHGASLPDRMLGWLEVDPPVAGESAE